MASPKLLINVRFRQSWCQTVEVLVIFPAPASTMLPIYVGASNVDAEIFAAIYSICF
jgi:hypothetical protein